MYVSVILDFGFSDANMVIDIETSLGFSNNEPLKHLNFLNFQGPVVRSPFSLNGG